MSEKLTPRQKKGLTALLSEPTVMQASESSGISRVTLYSYLSEPSFKKALATQQDEVLSLVANKSANLVSRSLEVLEQAMEDPKIKLRATDITLRHVVNLLEYIDLSKRIAIMEEQIDAIKPEN